MENSNKFTKHYWLQWVAMRAMPNPQDINRGPGLVTMFSNSVPFQANNWLPNCWSVELSKMRLLIYPSGRKGGHAPKTVQFRFLPVVQKGGSARSFEQRCHCLWLEVTDRSYCRIDRCTGIILLSLDWVLGKAAVCMGFYVLVFYTRRRICLMHFWCVLTRINTIGRWLSLTRF